MRDVEVDMVGAGLSGLRGMGDVDVKVVVGGIVCILRSGLGGSGVVRFVCHGDALVRSWGWLQ